MTKVVTVFGATGALGRHVIKHLLQDPGEHWLVRAVTRDPNSVQARRLATQSRVQLVRANTLVDSEVAAAIDGVDAVFAHTDFWSIGSVAGEREQGRRLLHAAEKAKVGHFVWSSLESAAYISGGLTPVAHFDSKAAVEHEIDWKRSDQFMRQTGGWYQDCVSVITTLSYFENFMTFLRPRKEVFQDGREGYTFWLPMDDAPYPMIALDDIGAFTAQLFDQREKWIGKTLRVGGDAPTLSQIASSFTEVTGIPARYIPLSREQWFAGKIPAAHDLWNQFRFHVAYGPQRNLSELRTLLPTLMTFSDWLKRTEWRGEPREVQKLFAQAPRH